MASLARPNPTDYAAEPTRTLKFKASQVVLYGLAIVGAGLMLFPFLWMVSTAFKLRSEVSVFPPTLIPKVFTLSNFENVFRQLSMSQLYWNTAYIAVIKTAIMVYTGALLGYIFGKFQFRGRDLIFYGILLTMILPLEVYVIPLYQMMAAANISNTHWALIVPHLLSAYAIFLFRQFMFSIPNDLIDAARIDGLGEWSIFHRIVLPLSGAALATTTNFYFLWNWNDFFWPLIVINDSKKMMLPVALATLVAERGNDYGLVNAGALLAVLPTLVLFFALQRFVVQGIALTGIK